MIASSCARLLLLSCLLVTVAGIVLLALALTHVGVFSSSSSTSSSTTDKNNQFLQQQPNQIKLALIPNGMTVSWATGAPLPSAPRVMYGTSPSSLTLSAFGSSHTYGTLIFHDVLLNNLTDDTLYYYQIVNANNITSALLNFTSALAPGQFPRSSSSSSASPSPTPTPAPTPTPYSVLIVGDMGLDNVLDTHSALTREIMQDNGATNLIVHIGDITYADDYFIRAGSSYEGIWNQWQSWMSSITSMVPYMVLPGNHEVTCNELTPQDCPLGQQNFTAYRHRFRMPGPESSGHSNFFYSFDYGHLHFIEINVETDYMDAPSGIGALSGLNGGGDVSLTAQRTWLEKDLQKANMNRGNVPWIVVNGHRPYYTASTSPCVPCQVAFETLLNKYNVDVYMSGHIHWYERLYAIALNATIVNTNYTQPSAPVYIVNGAAGSIEGHETEAVPSVLPPFSALVDNDDFGYGKFTVLDRNRLRWQFKRANDSSLVDEIVITKTH